MKKILILHYSEIGLKRSNAPYFVEKLRKRLKFVLEKRFRVTVVVKHVLSRLLIELPEDFVESEWVEEVMKVSGVRYFAFTYCGSVDIEELGEQMWSVLPEREQLATFRVQCKRSMPMKMKSPEIERELGAILLRKGIDLKVKLKGADLVVNVEFFNDKSYFSFQRYEGLGGLPANSGGSLVCLLSAGFDSPVAAFRMMRRGMRVIFVHFHGYPYTNKDEMEQVREIAEILANYQFDTKLYLVPFGEVQKEISEDLKVPGKVRTVLYRRVMLKIAEAISRKDGANGLLTGDNLGQVASQTSANLFAIDAATKVVVHRPLISFDKEEILAVAKQIGTYEIGSKPCSDTCTMFAPRIPELKANVRDMEDMEAGLPVEQWVERALEEAEVTILK